VIRQASENFKLTQQTNEILQALGAFNKQWGMFKDQMGKVDRALESSRKAYADLMDTRTRQLDRQVERVDDLRVSAGLKSGGEPEETTGGELCADEEELTIVPLRSV
jgi:DNA anti-recombination protein RmuC